MLRTVWKLRVLLAIAAVVLVAGGAVAFAASEGALKSGAPAASSGAARSAEGQTETSEPTKTAESTTPKGIEPTAPPQVNKPGRITSVNCAGGTITITVDGNDGAFTAQLTSQTEITINGHPGACSGLKVNWHVTMKAQQLNGQWVAQSVSQDDSSPNSGGGDHTPTPAPSH